MHNSKSLIGRIGSQKRANQFELRVLVATDFRCLTSKLSKLALFVTGSVRDAHQAAAFDFTCIMFDFNICHDALSSSAPLLLAAIAASGPG